MIYWRKCVFSLANYWCYDCCDSLVVYLLSASQWHGTYASKLFVVAEWAASFICRSSHTRGAGRLLTASSHQWGEPSSGEESCNSPAAECFSLFIVVYQFQIRCHDSIPKADQGPTSPYAYLGFNNGGTWKEVRKALRVFWLTRRKGQARFPRAAAAAVGTKSACTCSWTAKIQVFKAHKRHHAEYRPYVCLAFA